MKTSNCAWLAALALSVLLLTASPANRTGLCLDKPVSSHTTLAVADGPVPPHGGALLAADGPVPPHGGALLPADGPVPPHGGALLADGPVPPHGGALLEHNS
jgi:hypothetical protein